MPATGALAVSCLIAVAPSSQSLRSAANDVVANGDRDSESPSGDALHGLPFAPRHDVHSQVWASTAIVRRIVESEADPPFVGQIELHNIGTCGCQGQRISPSVVEPLVATLVAIVRPAPQADAARA